MLETTSVDNVKIAVYRGPRAIEIVLGPPKQCVIAHENDQKCSKR